MTEEKEKFEFEGTTISLFYTKIGINYISYLPSGKTVLVDKKEKSSLKLDPGIPYLSFVKKEIANTAFTTIISEDFLPRIIILADKILCVTKDEDDKAVHNEFQTLEEVFNFLKEKKITRIFVLIRYL